MNKIWVTQLKRSNDIISQLLFNRGIKNVKEKVQIERFLKPNYESDLNNPEDLPDFSKAKKAILKAYRERHKIGIYADYDADGIPGAAFLYKALKKIGFELAV